VSGSPTVKRLLRGGVDLHCHSAPSPFPRRIDHVGVARHYAEHGFRAMVAKSHHHMTAFDVAALQTHGLGELPVSVFGGVALNGAVGGINPHAVNLALTMGGRVVWLPTIGSGRHIEFHCAHPDAFPHPAVALRAEEAIDVLGEDGDLRPQMRQVLGYVAEADAVLASGHLSPAEILVVFEAAVAAGAKRLLLNHPSFIIEAAYAEAAQLVQLGTFVEHNLSLYDDDSVFCQWPVEELARWIKDVGAEHTVLASDLGQAGNPLPFDSYLKVCEQLLDCGVSEREIRRIVVENPARLVGLDH
jgi:Family of unknown function (DUF6282)